MTNANKVIIQETKNGQYFITLPKAIADFKGWKKGTKLEFTEDRFGEVIVKEVKV
jgi:bifunctional DNA-binding transcriptional regulator/antitoxin component of YhaV-PrlF toxin-antitoxin module